MSEDSRRIDEHNNRDRSKINRPEKTAMSTESQWQPIESAPKDGTPVLVKFKDAIPNDREDLRRWDGLMFVGRSHGNVMEWSFAAPVGQGGFPDEWMESWMPLPAPPSH